MISINEKVGKFMSWSAKKMSNSLEFAYKEPAKAAAIGLVTSLVTKDAASCVIYTTQSLNNEKIPEDKRRFVGYMDLINGLINVVGQVCSFFLVDHILTPKLQGLWTGKMPKKGEEITRSKSLFANDNITNIVADVIKKKKEVLSKVKDLNFDDLSQGVQNVSKGVIEKVGKESGRAKDIVTGVGIVVSALATTAFIKRVITPLFATPLAGKLADNVDRKKEVEAKKNKMVYDAAAVVSNRYNNKTDKTTFSQFNQKQS